MNRYWKTKINQSFSAYPRHKSQCTLEDIEMFVIFVYLGSCFGGPHQVSRKTTDQCATGAIWSSNPHP